MDLYQLLAALASAFGWPVAAVIIAAISRRPVSDLIAKLKLLRWGDKEAQLELPGVPVRELPPASPAPNAPAEVVSPPNNDSVEPELFKVAPAGAVLAGWLEVERALRRATMVLAPNLTTYQQRSPLPIVTMLSREKVLDPEVADAIRAALETRNSVAHGRGDDVTPEFARLFVEQCDRLARLVDMLRDKFSLRVVLERIGVDDAKHVLVRRVHISDGSTTGPMFALWTAEKKPGGEKRFSVTEEQAGVLLRRGAEFEEVLKDSLLPPP